MQVSASLQLGELGVRINFSYNLFFRQAFQSAFSLFLNITMFQDNPLLAQLKQQIHDSKEHVEGVVKSTDKAYGFLECDKKLLYCPTPQ